jgi:hypothetical protein
MDAESSNPHFNGEIMATQPDRAANGRFAPGWRGGPGRPRRATERDYLAALGEAVTIDRWRKIVERAASNAENGDAKARDWLGSYLVGRAQEVIKFSDPGENLLMTQVIMPFLMKMVGRHPEIRDELAIEFRRLGLPGPPAADDVDGRPVRITPLTPLSDRDDDGDGRDR